MTDLNNKPELLAEIARKVLVKMAEFCVPVTPEDFKA